VIKVIHVVLLGKHTITEIVVSFFIKTEYVSYYSNVLGYK